METETPRLKCTSCSLYLTEQCEDHETHQLNLKEGKSIKGDLDVCADFKLKPLEKDAPLHYLLARHLLETDHYATLQDTDEVLFYRDGIYTLGGEAYVKAKLQTNLAEATTTRNLSEEVLGHIKRSTYKPRVAFDSDPNKLVIANGILDLTTFKLEPHTPEYPSLVKLPVEYDYVNADCPKIKKFLSEVLYEEDLKTVQEYIGYCLWKGYPAQKALLCVGDGENGKSTLLYLIKTLLGLPNISSRSLQDLEAHRFAKAELFGKLANIYADLPDSALKSTGIFKMLTGSDPLTAEFKFKNGFSFVNHAKLWFSANRVPEVYEDSTAFFRRWIIVTFPNAFNGDKANRNLLVELTTKEELSGFLNWCIDGLMRLRNNGWHFSNSKSTETVRVEYIRKSSPIRAFLMDCIEIFPEGEVGKQELFDKFCEYCRTNKLPVITRDTFYKNLPLYVKVETFREKSERRRRMFRGIKWKDKQTEEDNDNGQATL